MNTVVAPFWDLDFCTFFPEQLIDMIASIRSTESSNRSVSAPNTHHPNDQSLHSAHAEITRLRAENTRLQERLMADMESVLLGTDATAQNGVDESKLKSALIRSQRDVVGGLIL